MITPIINLLPLLPHNYNFVTVLNYSVNIFFWTKSFFQRGHDPQLRTTGLRVSFPWGSCVSWALGLQVDCHACLAFIWVWEIWTPALGFAWQVIYPLSYLLNASLQGAMNNHFYKSLWYRQLGSWGRIKFTLHSIFNMCKMDQSIIYKTYNIPRNKQTHKSLWS